MKTDEELSLVPTDNDADPRAVLLAEYHRLVRIALPAAARADRWVLRYDHCFARVILDAIFSGCWYDHLARGRGRSAESQLDAAQLTRAVALARGMLTDGDAGVRRLNAQSLAWRGRRQDKGPGQTTPSSPASSSSDARVSV